MIKLSEAIRKGYEECGRKQVFGKSIDHETGGKCALKMAVDGARLRFTGPLSLTVGQGCPSAWRWATEKKAGYPGPIIRYSDGTAVEEASLFSVILNLNDVSRASVESIISLVEAEESKEGVA